MRCKYLGEMGCSSLHLLQEVAFRTGSFRSVRGRSALYTQWASTSWQTGAFAGDALLITKGLQSEDAEAAELGSYLVQTIARAVPVLMLIQRTIW